MSEQNQIAVIDAAWNTICGFEWLLEAHRNARKGKRYRPEIMGFTAKLEDNLLLVQQYMMDGSYELGPYRKIWVMSRRSGLSWRWITRTESCSGAFICI